VILIDSPVANVANIARALRHVGADLRITKDAEEIAAAEKIVLPGVGSFAARLSALYHQNSNASLAQGNGKCESNDAAADNDHVPTFHPSIVEESSKS